jgi:hypothetical protein
MREVYRAKDQKLSTRVRNCEREYCGRDVAMEVLPEEFAKVILTRSGLRAEKRGLFFHQRVCDRKVAKEIHARIQNQGRQ